MRTFSLAGTYQLWFATATVAAHAQAGEKEFRQRDVRFLIEVFSNWLTASLGTETLPVQNTQVGRYLDGLVREGYARRSLHDGKPGYRLTRVGLIELLRGVVETTYIESKEPFFFLYYYIKNYRRWLEEMIAREGSQFPFALAVELRELFDEKKLLQREIDRTQKQLSILDEKIETHLTIPRLVKSWLQEGKTDGQIVDEIDRRFPYVMHAQKPLSELMRSFPPDVRAWEIREGHARRVPDMLAPMREMLATYLRCLRGLIP